MCHLGYEERIHGSKYQASQGYLETWLTVRIATSGISTKEKKVHTATAFPTIEGTNQMVNSKLRKTKLVDAQKL